MEKLAELALLSLFGVYKTEEKSRLQGGKKKCIALRKEEIMQRISFTNQNHFTNAKLFKQTFGMKLWILDAILNV